MSDQHLCICDLCALREEEDDHGDGGARQASSAPHLHSSNRNKYTPDRAALLRRISPGPTCCPRSVVAVVYVCEPFECPQGIVEECIQARIRSHVVAETCVESLMQRTSNEVQVVGYPLLW